MENEELEKETRNLIPDEEKAKAKKLNKYLVKI